MTKRNEANNPTLCYVCYSTIAGEKIAFIEKNTVKSDCDCTGFVFHKCPLCDSILHSLRESDIELEFWKSFAPKFFLDFINTQHNVKAKDFASYFMRMSNLAYHQILSSENLIYWIPIILGMTENEYVVVKYGKCIDTDTTLVNDALKKEMLESFK